MEELSKQLETTEGELADLEKMRTETEKELADQRGSLAGFAEEKETKTAALAQKTERRK